MILVNITKDARRTELEIPEVPELTWTPECWAHTEWKAADLPREALQMLCGAPSSGGNYSLPGTGTKPSRRARHEARVAVLSSWVSTWLAQATDTLTRSIILRALSSWAASVPGDVCEQHIYLPSSIHRVLVDLADVLGDRGGAMKSATIASALRDVLEHYSEAAHERHLDRMIMLKQWRQVRGTLMMRYSSSSPWEYDWGTPLPEYNIDTSWGVLAASHRLGALAFWTPPEDKVSATHYHSYSADWCFENKKRLFPEEHESALRVLLISLPEESSVKVLERVAARAEIILPQRQEGSSFAEYVERLDDDDTIDEPSTLSLLFEKTSWADVKPAVEEFLRRQDSVL